MDQKIVDMIKNISLPKTNSYFELTTALVLKDRNDSLFKKAVDLLISESINHINFRTRAIAVWTLAKIYDRK